MAERFSVRNIIKKADMDRLMKYRKPEEVEGYCTKCPNYGRFWSCPPYDFDVDEHLARYCSAFVIGTKVFPDDLLRREKGFYGIYRDIRVILDSLLMEGEGTGDGVRALLPGSCLLCTECTRPYGLPCREKGCMRYSWESLGFLVSALSEEILGEQIRWSREKVPEYVFLVSGLLVPSGMENNLTEERLESLLSRLETQMA